jgi:cell wall assembly regulator SMI1
VENQYGAADKQTDKFKGAIMSQEWKYVEAVDSVQIKKIEKSLNITYPSDYIKALPFCNRGKPTKDCFDIKGRKECVLDYLINLDDVVKLTQSSFKSKLIPIGSDPFGNPIGYKLGINGKIETIVFWDHENKTETFVANTFDEFLKKLY